MDESPLDLTDLNDTTHFGHNLIPWFQFEPGYTNLNHGSYGSAPKILWDCRQFYALRSEQNPDRWLRYELMPRLKYTVEKLAIYLNVKNKNDLALVPNVSAGISAILSSFQWNDSDVLVYFSVAYGAVKLAIKHYLKKSKSQAIEIPINFPVNETELLESLETVLRNHSDHVKLIVVSHICSVPAFLMPVRKIVLLAKKFGVLILIDGAHTAGQIDLNLAELDPDFYVGTCHKWLFSTRGSAFIYVRESLQKNIHTVVISWNFDMGLQKEFHQQGTLDYSAFLTISDALKFRECLDDQKIKKYNRDLACYSAEILSKAWNTEILENAPLGSSDLNTLSMVNVRLPTDNQIMIKSLVERLMLSFRTFLATFVQNGKCYARISAQVYNERSDYVKLGGQVLETINDLKLSFTDLCSAEANPFWE